MDVEMQKVANEPCSCVRCGECDGSRSFWVDGMGHACAHWDLFAESENCEACHGSGLAERCDRCRLLDEMEHAADYARDSA